MGKRKFQLTENKVHQLTKQLERTSDTPTRTRLQAILWYGTGVTVEQIRTRLECSRASILGWCQQYSTFGPDGLNSKWQGGNNARLTAAQIDNLCARIQAHSPHDLLYGVQAATPGGSQWSVEDLHRFLNEGYGVVYSSRSSYYRLLKKYLERQKQLPTAR
ncbi:MAG TPA: helix-turn-helix domain-containing protein [Anaerolineales bacterium]|nr:helix-turn-helix domain-containing protein [Anaerolineales bacterium]